MEIQSIKQRFGIIGNSPLMNRAINIAKQVAATDLAVLITGESGTGKEFFPKIIHQLSVRKHAQYIAVNCGAIPEGTIDSELFGHEKGAFTSADKDRKGYFEVADGGTIFLDEVAELPLATQVRLLRVLETGEFLKVGSSKVQKTNVRIIAATNVDIPEAIKTGKFREDLYYRLNTVPIQVPALRERREDIMLLFKKFASDFAEKYRMPVVQLDTEAQKLFLQYRWRGNIRQLKNLAEQISIIEEDRMVNAETLVKYLPSGQFSKLPVLYEKQKEVESEFSERELLYKVLFDMKNDISELKKLVVEIIKNDGVPKSVKENSAQIIKKLNEHSGVIIHPDKEPDIIHEMPEDYKYESPHPISFADAYDDSEVIEESLSLEKTEIDLIRKALEKHKGKRKYAAQDLGISERTLYRKINEHNL